ncbi:MAG: hypothetical protein VX255_10570 [Candidatus Latescibacterota bacterium]|nr:hypothetical protein [Candidatus Latescibacterota bacterium]
MLGVLPGILEISHRFRSMGIEGSLGSGAFEALVCDELKHFEREDEYAQVLGRCRSLGLMGIVVSGAIAAWAVSGGYPVLIYASCAAALLAGLLLMLLPTAAPAMVVDRGFGPYVATLKAGVGEVCVPGCDTSFCLLPSSLPWVEP